MAPESRCKNGNTCGCRMLRTYGWAVLVPQINTRSDRVLKAMTPHTFTPAVGAECHCKTKSGLRRSPRSLHTQTRLSTLLRLNLNSSLKMTWFLSTSVQFSRTRPHSKRQHQWEVIKSRTCNGWRDSKGPTARCLRIVREDTGANNEGAICA
ncbi:uncharacterized protein TNCV_599001 [Trichonephila clavipes]|nr:uncharacterized protein TNCV_599001 [Trichonephila clavipes]